MKQFIVLCSSIVLGVFIYNLIAGGDDSSIMWALGEAWKHDMAVRSLNP